MDVDKNIDINQILYYRADIDCNTLTHKQYMVYHCNEMVVSVQIGCTSDQLGHCQDILSGYIFKLIINPGLIRCRGPSTPVH